jgi:hypothetical protein
MMVLWPRVATAAVLIASFAAVQAHAGEKGEKEPVAIIELGGAAERTFTGETSIGPSAAVEFEPIKDWLEIEVGTGALFSKGHSHWDSDFLFKKPFTLSDKVEFMVGVGPQWSQPFKGDAGSLGTEFALDFMFWPTRDEAALSGNVDPWILSGHWDALSRLVGSTLA